MSDVGDDFLLFAQRVGVVLIDPVHQPAGGHDRKAAAELLGDHDLHPLGQPDAGAQGRGSPHLVAGEARRPLRLPQVLVEERHGPLLGELRRFLVVARRVAIDEVAQPAVVIGVGV